MPYEGRTLKEFRFFPSRIYNNSIVSGNVNWVNPEYLIIEGEQIVQLSFQCKENQEEVICDVYIFGVNKDNLAPTKPANQSEYTNKWDEQYGDKIYETKQDISGKALLNQYADVISQSISNGLYGKITFENADNLPLGYNEVKWTFTPTDKNAKVFNGIIKFNVTKRNNNVEDEEVSQDTTLTASSIILSDQSAYDINVLNKPSKASFKFSSSDTDIATVNAKNGIVKSISEGRATITCEVTTPTESYSLTTDVTVISDDENYPMLNEGDLNLEVGDLFDLNAENYEKGSKIRYVSTNKEIAKVTSTSGKVTALKIGTANVRAIITNGDKVTVLSTNVTVE
jgi:hypothetical protein